MVLDLNVLPYFDDYNENKNFHKILFKPGVAVQARELTQLQSILQNQIERFGSHIFENGSRVLGGKFDPQDPVEYVRVNISTAAERAAIIGKELTGATTGLKANVIHAEADPEEAGVTVLFVGYSNTTTIGNDNIVRFQSENITYRDNNNVLRTISSLTSNTSGTGSIFGISEGVLFVQGFFVRFDSQKIAMDAFSPRANKKIYFSAQFSIVDSNQDLTLLDNAQGFNNFNAPGADRLKCELTLTASDLDEDLTDDSTFLLIEVRDGVVYQKQERTAYSEIYEELAKRTYDESGDYVVRGWNVYTREHLNTGTNGGRYTIEEGGDANKIAIGLEKGLGYVKGYEVNTLATRYIETDKATSYNYIDNQYSYVKSGPYTEINEIVGLPDPDSAVQINLYGTAEQRITNHTAYNTAATTSAIGTARVAGFLEESGEYGTAEGSMRLYIFDVRMNDTHSFADVRSLGNSNFFADVVLDNGSASLRDLSGNSKLMYVGNDYTKSVRTDDETPAGSVSFTFNRLATEKEIGTNGEILNAASVSGSETLPYGSGSVGSIAKETIILTLTEAATVTLAGTVSTSDTSKTVTGSSTTFRNLNEGDRLLIGGNQYIIDTIESDTSLTLTANAAATVSGSTFKKQYIAGDIIDLNSKGADNGTIRSANTTLTSIAIDLNETFDATTSCNIAHRIVRQGVSEVPKQLNANTVILIDGSSADSLRTFSLGVSDVFRIKQVRKKSSAFSANTSAFTEGEDVTNDFLFNNGQTDHSYDTAFMIAKTPIENTEHLLVQFDHFVPDYSAGGIGYFSIDSYPIDDETESSTTIKTVELPAYSGKNLRNFIDTRPVRQPTATVTTDVASATTNPAESTTYYVPTGGLHSPVVGTTMIYDYSYYLPRRDTLVVDKEGIFRVIKGQESETPPFPKISDTYMSIANLYIPPYPSVAGTYAKILGNPRRGIQVDMTTFSRHTMRDIGKMKKRIKDVEYYTAMSLLEKQTEDLLIPDENGLDRFKNGIFVDPFTDHSFGDTKNPDYNVSVDKRNKEIRPAYDLDSFETNYLSGINIAPVSRQNNLISIPYTETVLSERLQATTFRNVEFSAYRYIGVLNLYPDIDIWVDTTTVDKVIEDGSDIPEGQLVTTEWGAWQTTSSGAISGSTTAGSPGKYIVYFRNPEEFERNKTTGGFQLTSSRNTVTGSQGLGTLFDTDRTVNATPEQIAQALNAFNNTFSQEELQSRYRGEFNTLAEAQAFVKNTRQDDGRFFIVGTGGDVLITTETSETITEERTGIETTLTVDENLTDLGSFVTDVSLIPYIRPQTIQLYAEGLKRGTQYFVFFDGENMTEYCTPATIPTSGDVDDAIMGEEGSDIRSNAAGEVLVYLRLPDDAARRFRVGEKKVTITDSPTNDIESTSYANATFVSSGLNLQKQNTILSTKTIIEEQKTVTETRTSTTTSSSTSVGGGDAQYFQIYGPSCSAYSVYIDEPESTEGVFLTSVDVWFQSLSEELGVWFEIREMSSDGNLTRNQVPYSEVWMKRDDTRLKISTDGDTNATRVNFSSPVFLYNKTQYAFVIHTEGLNPDTYFWVSRLGETDVVTGEVVNSRPLTGTFYTTNNNLNWDIVPDIDLKVRFNRADFGASTTSPQTGVATFVNEDVEFITANTSLPATSQFFRTGELVRGSEVLTLEDNSVTVEVGDIISGAGLAVDEGDDTYETEATVVAVDGTNIFTDGFDFIEGANVEILYANTSLKGEATVSTVDYGVGVIDTIDRETNSFDIINSNGKFFVGSVMRSMMAGRYKTPNYAGSAMPRYLRATSTVTNPFTRSGGITPPLGLDPASATVVPTYTIEEFGTFDYSAMDFRPGYLTFESGTSVTFKFRGTTGTTIDTTEIDMFPNQTREFNVVKSILSRSEEVRLLNGEKSFVFKPTLRTTNTYLSPMIDKTLMSGVFTLNQLNNDITEETLPFGGNLESKYISRVVVLDGDNTAEDLLVKVAEYRPATADVKVWARIKSKYDNEDISTKEWFALSANKVAVSSSLNKENYIDTTYQIPADLKTGTFNEVQYTLSGNPPKIDASEMVNGEEYVIVSLGTTDFTEFGAATNEVNEVFTANTENPNNVAFGSGTISLASDVVYTGFDQFQIKIGFTGESRAVYPKASQLRAIALQV